MLMLLRGPYSESSQLQVGSKELKGLQRNKSLSPATPNFNTRAVISALSAVLTCALDGWAVGLCFGPILFELLVANG
jgi:hypothetical protein